MDITCIEKEFMVPNMRDSEWKDLGRKMQPIQLSPHKNIQGLPATFTSHRQKTTTQMPQSIAVTEKYLHMVRNKSVHSWEHKRRESQKKIELPDAPSAIHAHDEYIYFGFASGRVVKYNIEKEENVGECIDMGFTIYQLMGESQQILAMDCRGNVRLLVSDANVLTSTPIVTLVKAKKREKIKKIFNNFFNNPPPQQPLPTTPLKMHILPRQYRPQPHPSYLPLITYIDNHIVLYILNDAYEIMQQHQLMDDVHDVAMMEFGLGAFQHSNISHVLLVLICGSCVRCWREVKVEDTVEYVSVVEWELHSVVYSGAFISNNLIILHTNKGIQLANINQPPHLLLTFPHETKGLFSAFSRQNDNIFYLMTQQQMVNGHIMLWDEYMNKLLQEQQWEKSIGCALMISKNQMQELGGVSGSMEVRNRQMKQMCEKIALTYLAYELKNLEADHRLVIKEVIDFMVRLDGCEYLFTTIYQAIHQWEFIHIFVEELKFYIHAHCIPALPQPVFMQLLAYYKHDRSLLDHLIMSLDLSLIEPQILLTICLQHQLYHSLIHISTSQHDYITPLIKLCGEYYARIQQPQQMKQIAFFYLAQCLEGFMTPHNDEERYLEMLQQVISFVFRCSSVEMLLGVDAEMLIRTLNMFFGAKIMQFIMEHCGRFQIRRERWNGIKLFRECISEWELYERMLEVLLVSVEKSKKQEWRIKIMKLLSYLVIKNVLPFHLKYKVECFIFLLQHPDIFSCQLLPYLARVLNSITSEQDASLPSVLGNLLTNISLSPRFKQYLQLKITIHHELGQHHEVLQQYLKTSHQKAYEYAAEHLLSKHSNWKQLFQIFLINIALFFNISSSTMSLLVKTIITHSHFQDLDAILEYLPSYQHQLSFIEEIIPKLESTNLREKIILLHLEIVVEHKLGDLERYVEKMPYPLEECYRVCERVGNRVAMAEILVRSGRNVQGVKMLTEVFITNMKQRLTKLVKQKQDNSRQKTMSQLTKILNISAAEYENDQIKGEEIYMLVSEAMVKGLNIKGLDSFKQKEVKQAMEEIVSHYIRKMFSVVESKFFILFLDKFGNLPARIYIEAYGFVRMRVEHECNIQFLAYDSVRYDHLALNRTLVAKNRKSFTTANTDCYICMQEHDTQPMILYPCQHIYHANCLVTDWCPQCRSLWSYVDGKVEYTKLSEEKGRGNQKKKEKMAKLREWDLSM